MPSRLFLKKFLSIKLTKFLLLDSIGICSPNISIWKCLIAKRNHNFISATFALLSELPGNQLRFHSKKLNFIRAQNSRKAYKPPTQLMLFTSIRHFKIKVLAIECGLLLYI